MRFSDGKQKMTVLLVGFQSILIIVLVFLFLVFPFLILSLKAHVAYSAPGPRGPGERTR
jgi:hypothetical protein